jgi:DNA polymerase I
VAVTGRQGLTAWLLQAGVGRGDLVGLTVAADGTAGISVAGVGAPEGDGAAGVGAPEGDGAGGAGVIVSAEAVMAADAELRPRWAIWPDGTAQHLVSAGVRLATCWDIAAVHRLMFGGWRADPSFIWAMLHDLDPAKTADEGTLFANADEGYLTSADRDDKVRWAGLALTAARGQQSRLTARQQATAWSESAAELLCAELSADGLPMSRQRAQDTLKDIIGPRPRSEAEAAGYRAERDAKVLAHAPEGYTADLRSPQQVKDLLAKAGIDVPDTRAFRLREIDHPLVRALLEWRKAERIATTYGYSWLDSQLGDDGRLRGAWTGCDGAAGRMTASAGLHNMPAIMRQAVTAKAEHVFVRADLGQIEPRVLAAVSGDRALADATEADDLYQPVASQFGVSRAAAKVAVLGAMYGQTTGRGAQALRRLKDAYPVAMEYLDQADSQARAGHDLRTFGGRLVPMSQGGSQAQIAARGRYGRNAMIQGAAAEFFKMWAVTVRARVPAARIVLCLHDELLIHTPLPNGQEVARLVDECLSEAARRYAPGAPVRFTADISLVNCWADAKA